MNKSPTFPRFRDFWAVVFQANPIRARQIQDRMVADLMTSGAQPDELRARKDVRLAMLRWSLWVVYGWPAVTISFALLTRFAITNPLAVAWCKVVSVFLVIMYVVFFVIPQKYGMRSEILRSKGVSLD